MDFNNALSKLLGNDKSIDEVQIDQRVIDEIIKIAINADPKEYVALLSGKIDKHILKITGLIFLPYKASESSAVMQVFMMPMTTKAVGSVHSHPGPSAQPSQADLTFFQKNGYFHMIICRPYSEASIRAYDHAGNPLTFVIKDLGEEVEIKQWDELDIDIKSRCTMQADASFTRCALYKNNKLFAMLEEVLETGQFDCCSWKETNYEADELCMAETKNTQRKTGTRDFRCYTRR